MFAMLLMLYLGSLKNHLVFKQPFLELEQEQHSSQVAQVLLEQPQKEEAKKTERLSIWESLGLLQKPFCSIFKDLLIFPY